jgi:hypothetical protein
LLQEIYTEVERKREEIDNEVAVSAAELSMVIRALLKMRSGKPIHNSAATQGK